MQPLVLALNPSIDVEWRVEQVQWEEKNQILAERRWAGGKGINVARWLRHLGVRPRLLLPLGGSNGKELAGSLRKERRPSTVIPLHEETRANIIISPVRGRQLRFNPPGPKLSAAEWRSIVQQTKRALTKVSLLILSGSLPRGVSADAYAQLIQHAWQAGVRTLLDCDGPAFTAAVASKPFLVKPNQHELAQWFGRPLRSRAAIVRAASALSGVTGSWVLVSCGGDGAMLINRATQSRFMAMAPKIKSLNTVGAGDAMLAAAAWQIEQRAAPEAWLRCSVAVATAATQRPAGELVEKKFFRRMFRQVSVMHFET